jgi:methionyl-tRNA formyltransferase
MTKLVLCAYGEIGCRVLEHVADRSDIDELMVYTHDTADSHDVRRVAEEHDVPYSTDNISKAELPFRPDVIASVYYRYIIKQHVIDACDGRIFNTHPSLLPRHRGCSSVPFAIIEGDDVTGITYHYIDEGIDTGPIILQVEIPIGADETQAGLYARCMDVGAAHWPRAFELVQSGFAGVPQEGETCYHPREAPLGGVIDAAWPEAQIERFIRAMTYPPLPFATYRGVEVRTLDDYRRLRAEEAAEDTGEAGRAGVPR